MRDNSSWIRFCWVPQTHCLPGWDRWPSRPDWRQQTPGEKSIWRPRRYVYCGLGGVGIWHCQYNNHLGVSCLCLDFPASVDSQDPPVRDSEKQNRQNYLIWICFVFVLNSSWNQIYFIKLVDKLVTFAVNCKWLLWSFLRNQVSEMGLTAVTSSLTIRIFLRAEGEKGKVSVIVSPLTL